jgi:transketolase
MLNDDGIATRVVSMPSWELFEEQDEAYRDSVLLSGVPRLAVEAAASFGWERWADESVSIDRFGASAPGKIVLEKLGFTGENVAVQAKALVARKEGS